MLSSPSLLTFFIKCEAQTQAIGRALAPIFKAQDILLLSGPLGAGKTTFARSFIQRLTSPDLPVSSPTFPLICEYETSQGLLWHVDLYRLSPEQVPILELREHWSSGLTLVEWPERLASRPPDPLHATFTLEGQRRTLTLKGSVAWEKRLKSLKENPELTRES